MKSNLHKKYERDKIIEAQGVWFTFGDGVEIKIRSIEAPEVKKARQRIAEELKISTNRGDLADSNLYEFQARLASEALIVNWKNVTDEKDEQIIFSPESCYELVKDDSMAYFTLDIIKCANEQAVFKKHITEEAADQVKK